MTDRRAPSPKLTMAMNAPTPIARPSKVRTLRPGLRRSVSNAIPNSSLRGARIVPHFSHDLAVPDLDLPVRDRSHGWVVRHEHDGELLFVVQLHEQAQDLLTRARV